MQDENNKLHKNNENNKQNQKELIETLKEELDHWRDQ